MDINELNKLIRSPESLKKKISFYENRNIIRNQNKDINEINIPYFVQIKADVVIQNPPFGTKEKHIDKQFLEKAFTIAPVVYSLHKSTSDKFIKAVASDHMFKCQLIHEFNFPIKASMKHHKKKVEIVKVGCWKLVK